MLSTELHRRVGWLIVVRAVLSTVLLGSATFMQVRAPASDAFDPFFFLIALIFALTIAYALTLRMVESRRWLIDVQLAGDALIVSAFIYLTGGVTSYFALLYVLPIAAGAVVQHRRGGLVVATISAILYVEIVIGQYLSAAGVLSRVWAAGYSVALPPRSAAQYIAALNVFGFYAVALLSGSLAERVRSASVRLEQASSQIADLQALNQHVIDSLPSGLATTDAGLRILTFNRGAEAITGVPFTSAVGRTIDQVLQLPAAVVADIEQELRTVGTRRHEFHYRTGDGRDIEIGLGATHLETPGGRAGYLFTFQDITNIKKLERDAAMQQRLVAVGEMAAGIAHEIRNPLASMSGSIQILRQDLPLTSEQEQLMDIVLRESERLNTTIRSFLAYARPQRPQIVRLDVRRALTDTVRLLRNSADLHEQHVIDVDVPDIELAYDADEGQIKQILWNLATNGLRAMPDGGRLRLRGFCDSRAAGELVLTVEDEGAGIPQEELAKLFEPFHGRFAQGTGLGLAIVHRIVTDYNGTIDISSEVGRGTSVAVRLPARAVAAV